jgi:hypothetical protein
MAAISASDFHLIINGTVVENETDGEHHRLAGVRQESVFQSFQPPREILPGRVAESDLRSGSVAE